MASTKSSIKPATIQRAKVVDVDVATYTLSVATEHTKKPLTGVAFCTPYSHYYNGEGIYFMPEVGSIVWLLEPSDHHQPVVIAWGSIGDEKDHRNRRRDLNPGDIYLGTRDENFVILRRGGVVQIGGGPLSQRIFLPVNNTIKDFCENYGLHTLGGDLEWSVARPEGTTDGAREAKLRIRARRMANDQEPIADLEIGSHGEAEETILSLRIRASGSPGAAETVSLLLKKDGNVEWTVTTDFTVSAVRNIALRAGVNLDLAAGGVLSITAAQLAMAAGGAGVSMTPEGEMVLSSPTKVKIGSANLPELVVAEGTTFVVLATEAFLAMQAGHSHVITAPGQASGPPIDPATMAPYDLTGLVSTVLKAK